MTNPFASIGFLGFDVFGTVVDWRSGVARAVAERNLPGDPFAFAEAWRALYQPAMQRIRSGERPWVPLEVLNRENLEILLARRGLDLPEAALDDLNTAWEKLDPWPDSVEGLTRLKKRFTIAALSNGSIAGMTRLARFAGLPWDAITGAEIARNYKPTSQTYLKSAEAAGFRPDQCALVAAHNDDLEAARALGFRTIFVRRPREHGPDQTTDLDPSSDWDLVADDLIEVAARVS